jgi:hypothetical protein
MRWTVRHVESGKCGVVYSLREDAIKTRNAWRKHFPDMTYTLVRLTTRTERLKRKLLADSKRMDQLGDPLCGPQCCYYTGYARALRDVAARL